MRTTLTRTSAYDTVSKDKVCKTKTVDSVNEVLKKPTVKKSLDTLDDLSGKKMVNIPIGDYCVMQAKTFKLDVDEGQTNTGISHYLTFVGNPGTGKKYVAKLLGEIYHSFGILSKGHIVEVNGRELLGRCEGDTVRKLNQTIWKAQGGVLYIDEAYVLESQDDDGWDCEDEAVETLIKATEECKGDIIVILAGNKNKLQSFIYSVSELRSRFRNFIDFEDYSGEELNEVFKRILKENDYNIEEDALCVLERYLNNKKMNRFTKNSEDVYDLFEEIIGFQKRRVAKADNLSQEDSATIMLEDLPYFIE